MGVDKELFLKWAEDRFGQVKDEGEEIRINSIFKEDSKKHLYCNINGGKNKIASGVYHCWKSDATGTLVGLVMLVDKCSKKRAMEVLGLKGFIGTPIDNVEFAEEEQLENMGDALEKEDWKTIELPPKTYLIDKAPENWYQKCLHYLSGRKLETKGLFINLGERKYFGRIIIPYWSPDNKLIYFNGRTIIDDEPKYKGPDKTLGVGKGDVLYFTSYPKEGEKIYLCEGEIDAISLKNMGLFAVACGGKELSEKQASFLANYRVCLALDKDAAGIEAMAKMRTILNAFCAINPKKRLSQVNPPEQFKDWNKFYCSHNAKIVRAYIDANEKELESEDPYGFR